MAASTFPLFANLSFVLPSEFDGRERLVRLLEENGGSIREEENAREDAIYVFANFEETAFKERKSRGNRILGAPCVLDCVRAGRALPVASHPVFCLTMEGVNISCFLEVHEQILVRSMVEYMAGTFSSEISCAVDFVIASDVLNPKYQSAVQRSIPVVHPTWIYKCWQERAFIEPKTNTLPPFAGLFICVTGINAQMRNFIQKMVEELGGFYCPHLTRRCHVLIAAAPTGDKYQYATAWGIRVVTSDWFFDCLNAHSCVDFARYPLTPTASRTSRTSPTVHPAIPRSPSMPILPPFNPTDRSFPPFAGRLAPDAMEPRLRSTVTGVQPPSILKRPRADSSALQALLGRALLRSSLPGVYFAVDGPDTPVRTPLPTPAPSALPLPSILQQPPRLLDSMNTLEQILGICNAISAAVLTPSTVCDILEGVDEERNPSLRSACLQFISEHYEEVIKTVGPARLSPATQREIDRIRDSYHHSISPSSSSSSSGPAEPQQHIEPPVKRRRLSRNFDTE
jgi:hypothetical protein